MAIEPHSEATALNCIDDDDLENRSISELVSFLRTAFRTKDFDKVEEILVAKEVKMRKEIENKNKECEMLQTSYEFLRLDNLTHKATLEQDEKWKETYEKLKERECEVQKLKELIVKVEEDREKKKSALEDDKKIIEELKRKNSEFECAMDVVKKTKEDDKKELNCKVLELECAIEVAKKTNADDEKTIEELKCKNSELECAIEVVKKTEEDYRKTIEELKCKNLELERAKREVEHDYEQCKREYKELWHQVVHLENRCTMLKNAEPVPPNRDDSKSGACSAGYRKLVGKRGAEKDKIENQTGTGGCMVEIISDDDHVSVENLSRARRNQKRKQGSFLNDYEDYDAERDDDEITILPSESKGKESLKKVGAMFATPPYGRPDKHILKKHFSPGTNDSKNTVTSSRAAAVMLRPYAEKVGAECKSLNSKFKYAAYGMDYSSEDCSISSESDGDMKNRYDSSHLKSKDQVKRCNRKWKSEAEMLAAFDESDFLCMEAVCILYRQSSLTEKLRGAYLSSRHRGFNEADVLRGTTLALFLTNGDSHGKLKKSTAELKKFDICGLLDCRRIAIEHLKQLFEIYKNNEDQFLFH